MSHLISHRTDHLVNHLINISTNRVCEKEVIYLFRYLISLRMSRMYSTYVALYSSVSFSLLYLIKAVFYLRALIGINLL